MEALIAINNIDFGNDLILKEAGIYLKIEDKKKVGLGIRAQM